MYSILSFGISFPVTVDSHVFPQPRSTVSSYNNRPDLDGNAISNRHMPRIHPHIQKFLEIQ